MQPVLVDRRNFATLYDQIHAEISTAKIVGIDCETQDSARHAGLAQYNTAVRLVFDQRRQVMTGLSIYADNSDNAYYFNLNHADVENRLAWDSVKALLNAKTESCVWVAHNAPFELTVFKNVYDYDLAPIICTLQMAVSAYSPDEYDANDFVRHGLGGFRAIVNDLFIAGSNYEGDRNEMTPLQQDVFNRITAKASEARFSYNGFVRDVCYGYGLKKAVKSWFGHDMTTYEEVLGKRAHMGELTGQEVVAYGADDAYWCVRLYHELLAFMMKTNPQVVTTFFEQENPMVHVFSDVWRMGMKVNIAAIKERQGLERASYVKTLRRLKAAVRTLLPFRKAPHIDLAFRDPWYAKGCQVYRDKVVAWVNSPDAIDDFAEIMKVRGAVSNAWALDRGVLESSGVNLSHYMPMRVLLYDLLGSELILSDGKTSSDGEARGRLKEQHTDPTKLAVLDCLTELANIETKMKLFITPYLQLTDPETSTMYPVLTSKLASRRMATSAPNGMQLTKKGDGVYIRGFYLPDNDEHLIVSVDWSGIELVEIGEFSGDPGFTEAFGELPHKDLHSKAAASLLRVELGRDVSVEDFKRLPRMTEEEAMDVFGPKVLTSTKGTQMTPAEAYKFHRGNDGGKGANFNYWYSGAFSTIAEKRGWTSDQMWKAVEAYREEFPVAEKWRTDTIQQAVKLGYVQLPDGHRRSRYEATEAWHNIFLKKFEHMKIDRFMSEIARSIQSRAKNQAVNSLIQGSCATIAKRSILRIREATKGMDMRFLLPIHDELVFSVHHSIVPEAINLIRGIMCDHPTIIKNLKMDASPSVGRTFQPWSPTCPYGQVELYEAPPILGFKPGSRLDDDGVRAVVEYLRNPTLRTTHAA
jgi:DNA polymerase I-like protein with 3'-5' exonuclease and polymerase domains